MLKFGTDKSTSKITLSFKEVGENLEFECFCPKIFSSITPLHLDDRFRELKRRLIVVPCSRVEELSDERKAELDLLDDSWQSKLLDLSAYDWKGFSKEFDGFWDLEMAELFLATRSILAKSVKGLSSQQRAISLDLLATGITSDQGCNQGEGLMKPQGKIMSNYFLDPIAAGIIEHMAQKLEVSSSEAVETIVKEFSKITLKRQAQGGTEKDVFEDINRKLETINNRLKNIDLNVSEIYGEVVR